MIQGASLSRRPLGVRLYEIQQRMPKAAGMAWVAGAGLFAVTVGVSSQTSLLIAGALIAPLGILLAGDLPASFVLGALLSVRVLVDAQAGRQSQQTTSISPSVVIAVAVLALAGFGMYRYGRGVRAGMAAFCVIAVATFIAALQLGHSTLILREPIREASIVAVGLVALNFPRFRAIAAARVVQAAGAAAALVALYQGVTHSGVLVAGSWRSNGTFAHPNSAALYFGIAATASLWRYLECGRRGSDGAFFLLYVSADISTFSLGGMAALFAMLLAYGALRRGSATVSVAAWVATALLVVIFLATPLGSTRLTEESSAAGSTYTPGARGQTTNSLGWRIYNWGTLIPIWKRSPVIGQGIGATLLGLTPTGKNPHNEYIRYLVETGLAGLALLLLGVRSLIRGLRRVKLRPDGGTQAVLALAILSGAMLNALVANTLVYTPAAYAMALLVGAALRPSPGSFEES